jgi:hypothetical protein
MPKSSAWSSSTTPSAVAGSEVGVNRFGCAAHRDTANAPIRAKAMSRIESANGCIPNPTGKLKMEIPVVQHGNHAPTIRPHYPSSHQHAFLYVRIDAFPNRRSPRRGARPGHLGARSVGCDLGWNRFLVDRCEQ